MRKHWTLGGHKNSSLDCKAWKYFINIVILLCRAEKTLDSISTNGCSTVIKFNEWNWPHNIIVQKGQTFPFIFFFLLCNVCGLSTHRKNSQLVKIGSHIKNYNGLHQLEMDYNNCIAIKIGMDCEGLTEKSRRHEAHCIIFVLLKWPCTSISL